MLPSLRSGYRALVFGAGGGIGGALAAALEADARCAGVAGLSRRDGFELEDEASVAAAAARFAEGEFDVLLDATGALRIDGYGPEKALREIDPAGMARQFAVNAIGPALILKHFVPLLPRGRRSLFATLSARVGSIGDNRLGGWISYRAAKAALNQILRTAAVEVARRRPEAVLAALHPGTVATPLSEPFAGTRDRLDPADAARRLLVVLDGLPAERSGCFVAYDGRPIEW
ncbi:SDR family oxidoreductase [Aureimonas flava]|uniref:SDR family oxidoreductase n=1 Tax=Aureimonas flava TaxID=2320271 RepID=A0A3A1WPD3_9HYPH|nr:SDR family NAD(P)-dependent oxidoreductase [Aureimonas flava]RIY01986.1 SDR family oxidoreductase [Aureimonas flava]